MLSCSSGRSTPWRSPRAEHPGSPRPQAPLPQKENVMPRIPDHLSAKDPPPAQDGVLARLADFAYRRKWRMLGFWVIALVGLGILSGALKGAFKADYSTPGSDSKAAAAL